MDSDQLLTRLERMKDAIPVYAWAKADRVYLDHYRKSLLAILSAKSPEASQTAKESWARRQKEYCDLLTAIKEAIELEEKHRWALEHIKMDVSVWQTLNANDRAMKNNI